MNRTVKQYTLAQMLPGLSEQFSASITEEKMAQFYALTGDCSPIHRDVSYAAERGYPGRVVYGMLSASLVSTLAGVYLPGVHCLLHEVDAKFVRPVFIGDTLTISGTVAERSDTFHEVTVKFQITNQDGQKVVRGTYKAGLAE